MNASRLAQALQHADSNFPAGGFAFSQGLESAAAFDDRLGGLDLDGFISVQIRHRWSQSERVALIRAFRGADDLEVVGELDLEVEAASMIDSLRNGSRKNGSAFLAAHRRLSTLGAADYYRLMKVRDLPGHLCVLQGFLWQKLGFAEDDAVVVAGYQAVNAITNAAVRLGIATAIEAQGCLSKGLDILVDVLTEPVQDDTPIASFAPLADIGSTWHGTSGQRLFAN